MAKSSVKKVVLAYSGGLDTSIIIPWLREHYQCEVIAFAADVGQGGELTGLKEKAVQSGASKCIIQDLRKEFCTDYLFPMLQAGAVYEGEYLLGTSIARPIIARRMMDVVEQEGADAVAHGCTGKGNDQVRFELTAKILDPKLEIIAPLRIWEFKTRDEEIDYAKEKNIPIDVTKKSPYSIDKNIYGMSIECGILEDPWQEPPEDVYQMTTSPQKAPNKATYITIDFEKGIPKKVNGKSLDGISLLNQLNDIGGKNAVGRADVVENRLVGIKSREIYEAPAGTILHIAHKELEALVLDRETAHYKEGVALKYADIIYFGLWETPLKKQLDSYINKTQENVSGTIRLKLYKGNCIVVGRKSPHSLYKEELATYGDKDVFDQKLAEGFIKIFGMQY